VTRERAGDIRWATPRVRPGLAALLAVVLAVAVACSGQAVAPAAEPDPQPDPQSAPESQLWSERPVVDLRFDVADDLRSVTGNERVVFTPDLRVCELVFRAWPNKPATARTGSSLTVTDVVVAGSAVVPTVSSAGAPEGAPGTLVRIPLPACIAAGEPITADLAFTLTLGERADERVGVAPSEEVAWFGSAFPLLAWERERGWATEPAVAVAGEVATSEDFRLRSLEVAAPSRYSVQGSGSATGRRLGQAPGTTVHAFTAPALRDVMVSVGRLQVVQAEVDGVRVHLAASTVGTVAPLSRWVDRITDAIDRLSRLLGPFPYPDLWVTVLSSESSGIEFPGAIQFADVSPRQEGGLVSHEVAHMWFYALVGNNQGRDPWLDESFATLAQLVADDGGVYELADVPPEGAGQVGRPMSYWARFDRPSEAYTDSVYVEGGAALYEARRRAGPAEFDLALRRYVRDNAHRVAVPADVAAAFAELPEVLELLRNVGALR
jgi:hypothetical protein